MIIDSQVHAYEANTPKRPWHSVPNWPDHVTGDEMVAAMDKDQHEAADTRTEAEKWLGDPPPSRSALAQRNRR
jgi:hypothetical protein